MDNLDNINTVQDLLNAQESPAETSDEALYILGIVYKHGPDVGKEVALNIIGSLANYHADSCSKNISEGDADAAASWAYDEALLKQIYMILKNIEV